MSKAFIDAIEALEKEKDVSKDVIFEAIESALISAYKKNYGTSQNVRVEIDKEDGEIDVFMQKDVVEEVEDDSVQISIEEAREIDPRYEVGDIVEYQVKPRDFGRIAAQTAKQVVVQRIREAERSMIYDEFINKQGEIVNGTVQRISHETIFVNMGKAEGILSAAERVPGERFQTNDRLKVYIMDVKKTTKGPQVFLSRSHPSLVRKMFELEVPEIEDGIVEIKSIAREAGSRTKIAVHTDDENVDPIGACVGARGSRVQNIVDELFGEKIDITVWSEDPKDFISNVLSPATVEEVFLDDSEEKAATVVVPDHQLSLAIGKEGQNVRLAAKLCNWKIDIKSHSQYFSAEETFADDDMEFTDDDVYYYDADTESEATDMDNEPEIEEEYAAEADTEDGVVDIDGSEFKDANEEESAAGTYDVKSGEAGTEGQDVADEYGNVED